MFTERLKKLRLEAGYSNQKSIAQELGTTQQSYSQWESGKRTPNSDSLDKLAKFFNVSTDYLLGNTDTPNTPRETDLLTLLNTGSASFDGKPLTEHDQEILLQVLKDYFDGTLQEHD